MSTLSARTRQSRAGVPIVLATALLSACATVPFEAQPPQPRISGAAGATQTGERLQITANVVSDADMQALSGLDVYAHGVQPVWIEIENRSDSAARLALSSIDKEYFPPYEIAWLTRKSVRRRDRDALESWLFAHRLPRQLPAGATISGFVFTNAVSGTKAFNLDVSFDGSIDHFTFFVPAPGLSTNHMDVAQDELYAETEIASHDRRSLGPALARHACCEGEGSTAQHDVPFNVALVGTGEAVHRALLRTGWHEPSRRGERLGEIRGHRYLGRAPDGSFVEPRSASGESRELHLWLAPLKLGDVPVWIGHTVGTIDAGADVDPDIDDARLHLLQELWLGQALAAFGSVPATAPVTIEDPAQTATGDWYFTDGRLAIMFLSEKTVAANATDWLEWEENVP